jgi:predicted RNase H-like HicB family nuclease
MRDARPNATMKKRRITPDPDPEEIIVRVHIIFDCYFYADPENGGYFVRWSGHPDLEAWGKTLRQARAEFRREVKDYLDELAEKGKPIPQLDYAPSWRVRQLPEG